MNKSIVLQAENQWEFESYIRRKTFFRNGKQAMRKAEGKHSKAFIIPFKSKFNELGWSNALALVATGIKLKFNESGESEICPLTGKSFEWDYCYEFDKIETVKFSDLVSIIGNPYNHPKAKGGNNFYWSSESYFDNSKK
jgi:hypothetical protein